MVLETAFDDDEALSRRRTVPLQLPHGTAWLPTCREKTISFTTEDAANVPVRIWTAYAAISTVEIAVVVTPYTTVSVSAAAGARIFLEKLPAGPGVEV